MRSRLFGAVIKNQLFATGLEAGSGDEKPPRSVARNVALVSGEINQIEQA